MARNYKVAIVGGESLSRFKTTEQIYYNRGFKQDAVRFNLLGDEPMKNKKRMKHTAASLGMILFRMYTLFWFVLYFIGATVLGALRR